jgi:hypothetical protein
MRHAQAIAVAALALAVALLAAGCGGSPGDLIELEQSGGFGGGARQNIVIQNNGEAACNKGKEQDIGSKALIDARELERDLGDLADNASVFEAPAGTPNVRSYVARLAKGTVRWQDRAPRLPPVLAKAQLMTLQLARKLC